MESYTTHPTMQPQTDCLDRIDVTVIDQTATNTAIDSEIISITELNFDSVGLDLTVPNDFGMISIGYDDSKNNHRECYQDFDVLEGEIIHINAACYDNFASLTVIVYVGDNFDIDSCTACSLPSEDTDGFTAITFEVPCEPVTCEPSSMPSPSPHPSSDSFSSRSLSSFEQDNVLCSTGGSCDEARRLHTPNTNTNVSITQGLASSEKKAAKIDQSAKEFEEYTPYCVHEDFPCEGDEEFMVHVCYHSSRFGYQTFCISEIDSDILRLNEKHHCGPCKDWNGEERTVQMM